MKRYTAMLTLVSGLLLCCSQAFGLPLLAENFNDITLLTASTSVRTVDNILTTTPGELPAGTMWLPNATPGNTNVRRTDNPINTTGTTGGTSPTPANFNYFFEPAHSTNKFLVIGDVTNTLTGVPVSGISSVSMPFTVPNGVTSLEIKFDWAFNGWDANNQHDIARIYLTDGTNIVLLDSATSSTRLRNANPKPNYAAVNFDDPAVDIITLAGSTLRIVFELNEVGTNTNDSLKDTALGIDNIEINSNNPVVPEPSTFLLIGTGLSAVALLRRRRG